MDRGQSSGFGAGGLPRLVKGGDVVFDVLFGYGVRFVDAAGFEPINVFGDVGFVGGDGWPWRALAPRRCGRGTAR